LHNKLDLIQAEAVNELIHAQTRMALKQSLAQLEGSFSAWILNLEQQLVKALALSEASFEFLDEEMEFGSQIYTIIHDVLATIATIKQRFDQQQHIRQGIRVALIGSVNAGKSSLFNALLNKNRSIVTSRAGTTRDVIEAGLYKNNSYWTLIDTAGLRQTEDSIEQEGIARSLQEAGLADIIILVIDQSRVMTPQERAVYEQLVEQYCAKIVIVHNKIDLPSAQNAPLSQSVALAVSSATRHNIQTLEESIEHAAQALFQRADAPFLLNKRQFNLILGVEQKLQQAVEMLKPPIAYELLSYHLQDSLAHFAELTGKSVSERGMDAVFKEFCVGK
jgi:tRNA modification GTPase